MPPQAYALVATFALGSAILGVVAMRILARAGGPSGWRASALPFAAAFGAFYLIGHRLGISLGPNVELYGFQVALLGDLAIGSAAALAVAWIQAVLLRRRSPGA